MKTLDNEEYKIPGEWTIMWKIRILQRVKVFLWRKLRGVLSTQMRLKDKDVTYTNSCPQCEINYEND
jgi:hypothetical protein